jgi:glucose-6-phosphate 1-dehydrogenase
VIFGVSGDLAFKDIFSALQGLAATGQLDMPVIGVARSDWTREDLIARARASVETHGGLDREAFGILAAKLHYIRGDYQDPLTFTRLREELGRAKRPCSSWRLRRRAFTDVIRGLASSGCIEGARLVLEKPFEGTWHQPSSSIACCTGIFPESSVFRIDHFR